MSASKKKTNDFLKQGSILAVAGILCRVIGLIYRIPMANILGEEGNGIYGVAFNLYNLMLLLSSYSLPLAVSKLVATKNVKKEYRNAYHIFKNAMYFALASGTFACSILYFGADALADAAKYPGVSMPLRVLAPTIIVVAIIGVLRGFFQGKNTMVPTALSQILEQIINAIVSVYAAYAFMKANSASDDISAYGAMGGTWGTFWGAVTALIFLIFVFLLYYPTINRQLHRDKNPRVGNKEIYRMLFYTITPVILSQTVFQISSTIDVALFGNVMAAKGVDETVRNSLQGVFSSQYTVLINVPLGIATAMGTSMIPSIVSSFTLEHFKEVKEKVRSVVKFNMLIAFPSALGLTVLAGPITTLLFPSLVQYRTVATGLLTMGSMAIIFYALSTVTSGILQAVNQMRIPVIHSAISLALHIVIVFVLLQFTDFGIYSLVAGTVTFPLVVCILNWNSVRKILHYKQEIRTTFLIPFLSSVIMAVAAFGVYQGIYAILHSNLIGVMVSVIVAVIVYCVSILLLKGVTDEELVNMPMGDKLYWIAQKLHLI